MKIILTTLALVLSIGLWNESALAKDYNSFDVTEIFQIDSTDETVDEGKVDGSFNLTEQLILEAEEAGSPAAALLIRVINILTLLIGTFAFVMIIIGGFTWATSGGDETKIDKGKAILTQTILGLVVAFTSYLLVTFVLSFFF